MQRLYIVHGYKDNIKSIKIYWALKEEYKYGNSTNQENITVIGRLVDIIFKDKFSSPIIEERPGGRFSSVCD